MSFWNLNDGTQAESTSTFEIEGGNIAPIPDNTACIAAIEEAEWNEYEGDRYISIKWRILSPDNYAKRVVFHKVKIFGMKADKDKKSTSDKAKKMLAAIDANAGGKLSRLRDEPTDDDLMSTLVGKVMAIKLKTWKMHDKSGNWVCAVAPAKNAPAYTPPPKPSPVPMAQFDGDEIPFN